MSLLIRLLICRHGESTADLPPRCIEGSADFPLSDLGMRQAAALAAWLGARYQPGRILSSPLMRARQTAEAISAATNAPLQLESRLAERSSGRIAGLRPDEADRLFPVKQHPVPINHRPPGGESYLDLYSRVAHLWCELHHDTAHDGQTLLLVSHGGAISALMQAALGLPPSVTGPAFPTDDTGLHELQFEPGGRVRLTRFNYTVHTEGLV
ncbi:MAG: phosphoglycerate mutase family protein [Symbiobacteriaceae bacterium]|nr:phosphoglycerate mutase family protein [Symbiobacteriaceae bacterium]